MVISSKLKSHSFKCRIATFEEGSGTCVNADLICKHLGKAVKKLFNSFTEDRI